MMDQTEHTKMLLRVQAAKIERLKRDTIELGEEIQRQQRQMAEVRKELFDAKRALPIEKGWAEIQRRCSQIPDGFVPLVAFTDGKEIIVCTDPPTEEEDPLGQLGKCDDMGRSTWPHVLVRVDHPSTGD